MILRTVRGWEGGLPPQRGCPAGDPGLAPALRRAIEHEKSNSIFN
jgi:hypothetical protein